MPRACAPTPRRLGWRVAAVALLGSLCCASGEPPLTLTMRAPDGCPGQDALHDRVRQLLGEASPSRLSVTASVVVEPDAHDGFRLHMDTTSAGLRGRRTITGPSCRAVLESAALVLALMIDFEAVSESSPAASSSAAPPVPSASSSAAPLATASASASAAPPPPPPAETSRATRLRWHLDAAAVLETGALPGVGAGVAVGAAASTERARLGLRGLYFPPRERRLTDRPDAGGDFRMTAAAAEGCLRPSPRWPWGCVGAEVARIAGAGAGIREPAAVSGWLLSAFVGARATWFWSDHVGLFASAEAHWQPAPPRFAIEAIGPVFRPSSLAGRGSVGLAMLF